MIVQTLSEICAAGDISKFVRKTRLDGATFGTCSAFSDFQGDYYQLGDIGDRIKIFNLSTRTWTRVCGDSQHRSPSNPAIIQNSFLYYAAQQSYGEKCRIYKVDLSDLSYVSLLNAAFTDYNYTTNETTSLTWDKDNEKLYAIFAGSSVASAPQIRIYEVDLSDDSVTLVDDFAKGTGYTMAFNPRAGAVVSDVLYWGFSGYSGGAYRGVWQQTNLSTTVSSLVAIHDPNLMYAGGALGLHNFTLDTTTLYNYDESKSWNTANSIVDGYLLNIALPYYLIVSNVSGNLRMITLNSDETVSEEALFTSWDPNPIYSSTRGGPIELFRDALSVRRQNMIISGRSSKAYCINFPWRSIG